MTNMTQVPLTVSDWITDTSLCNYSSAMSLVDLSVFRCDLHINT